MISRAPGVLDTGEMHEIAELFGVGEAQVRRDHVISHALAALSTLGTDDLVFFGGTALSRTHLPALRLSEDIDLISLSPRAATASAPMADRGRRPPTAVQRCPARHDARPHTGILRRRQTCRLA